MISDECEKNYQVSDPYTGSRILDLCMLAVLFIYANFSKKSKPAVRGLFPAAKIYLRQSVSYDPSYPIPDSQISTLIIDRTKNIITINFRDQAPLVSLWEGQGWFKDVKTNSIWNTFPYLWRKFNWVM
jgi:hypothetical protein